jgi:hypothetical protein
MTFVLESQEWKRPGKCKADTFSMTFNGKSFVSSTLSNSVCDIAKLYETSPYLNWDPTGTEPFNGKYALWTDAPALKPDNGDCFAPIAVNRKGQRFDFAMRLKDSGDGQYPTTLYVLTKSVYNQYCG